MDAPLIEIQNVWKRFPRQQVLRGVDLAIRRGESIVVLGQSGCGKSVLLKHIIRLLDPDRGTVLFDSQDVAQLGGAELTRFRRRVGMLFQSAALFDSLSVAENVGLGLKESRQYKQKDIDEIVVEKLRLVGLADAKDKNPAELSGGMRKRVGLARAIASDPEVLLYDEPTTGLDPITADRINELIVALHEQLHVTSVAVTHDMTSAFRIASRMVMLYDGRVQFDGTPDEVRHTDNALVHQFITGSSSGPIQVG